MLLDDQLYKKHSKYINSMDKFKQALGFDKNVRK